MNASASIRGSGLLIEFFQTPIDSRNQLGRILMINLLEDLVRQIDTINLPKSLWRWRLFAVRKILVSRFEKTPIKMKAIFRPRSVGTEQNSIGVFDQELTRRVRLPAQFTNPRRGLDPQVRIGVQPLADRREIFRVVGDVSPDELGGTVF